MKPKEKMQKAIEKDSKNFKETSNPAKMSNHIEEYFVQREASKEVMTSKELFKAEEDNVDIKTDLSFKEIMVFNRLIFNDSILKSKKLTPVFRKIFYPYFRLKISLDRKSRGEFVSVNQGMNTADDILAKMSNISNITGAKK